MKLLITGSRRSAAGATRRHEDCRTIREISTLGMSCGLGASAVRPKGRQAGSAMVAYLVAALIIMATIAAIATYVQQNLKFSGRRQDMVNAIQYAQAGAAIACVEANKAYTNGGTFISNLTSAACGPYVKNNKLTKGKQWVYERTISSPFTNQTVLAQIWWTNSASPTSARIVATATFGNSTQTAETDVEMNFSLNAAIISTAQGDTSTSASKGTAQGGDVVVLGGKSGRDIVDGGIISNGAANTNTCTVDIVSKNRYGTAFQIPDYTSPGSLYQLFDFSRFIAVADKSGNHYTNANDFVAKAATGAVLEGVVVEEQLVLPQLKLRRGLLEEVTGPVAGDPVVLRFPRREVGSRGFLHAVREHGVARETERRQRHAQGGEDREPVGEYRFARPEDVAR